MRSIGSERSWRRTRCCRTRSARELYDRFGHAGLRSGGFQPSALRPRQPVRPLLRVLRRRPLRHGRPRVDAAAERTSPRASRSSSQRSRPATKRDVPFGVAVPCARCAGNGDGAGHADRACPTCGGNGRRQPGLAQRLRRVRPDRDLSDVQRLRESSSSIPASNVRAAGRVIEERTLEVEIPAGDPRRPAHPPQRRRTRRRRSVARPATSTSRCASGPTSGSSARGTTSTRRST